MKLYFWQNIISPHQLDFLREISTYHRVMLIVEQVQDQYRANDKWEVPTYDFLDVIVAPDEFEMKTLFLDKNDFHIFSGISSYKMVHSAFKMAVAGDCKIGIISEPLNLKGVKGALRLMRGKIQQYKYGSKIKFIAATGYDGVETYRMFGYDEDKIFQWGYFVNELLLEIQNRQDIIFVGNLNYNKQIEPLVNLVISKDYDFRRFHIVGSGPLEMILRNNIAGKNDIIIHGRQPSAEVMDLISQSKVLIIPSLHDGWAVVVNEALLCGTPVIASDAVGARILIEDSDRGDVFKTGNLEELDKLIRKWASKSADYKGIQKWAQERISPLTAANYFTQIIEYCLLNSQVKPTAPWQKK